MQVWAGKPSAVQKTETRKAEALKTDTVTEMRFKYYYWEAVRLAVSGDYERAIALFRFCDLLQPGDPELSRVLGIYHYNDGRRDQAMRLLEVAYRQAPENTWYEYSTALMQGQTKQDKKQGLRVLEEAARLMPDKTDILERLQAVYMSERRWTDVLRVQDRLDSILGYDMYSAEKRFRINYMMKKPDAALAALKRYLDDDPSNLQMWLLYLQASEVQGGGLKALEPIYQQVLHLDPFNATALNNYAYALVADKDFGRLSADEKKERLQQAEVMVRRALTQEPENLSFMDTYAWVLYLAGNKPLARYYMTTVIESYRDKKPPKEVKTHADAIFKK